MQGNFFYVHVTFIVTNLFVIKPTRYNNFTLFMNGRYVLVRSVNKGARW
jgi:hypothetical protein